ncbi:MAG: efflux RND transporter periplasmic adaptor subunit [Bacteroidetes bacterium]|nr:efflux RND transporter periplasmic adaptor subunit [Bacteroidota bacterium]
MKKLKIVLLVIGSLAIIVAVLLRNRAQIKAETRDLHIDTYAVSVAAVDRKDITDDLNLVGTINADNDVRVISEASGKVTKVLARVGDYEPAGAVLLRLDDKLQSAALELAKVNLDKATKDYTRYRQLYSEHSVTDAQLESAQLAYESANDQFVIAHRQYDNTRITSPISGIVTSRTVDIGTYVDPGMAVAEVVDISKLKVTVNVGERDVMDFKIGDRVAVTTDVYPGVQFTGRIKTISSKGDADHTYPMEVEFPNSSLHPLKAGMFANVHFNVKPAGELLVIPRQSLVGSIEKPQVFVVKDGVARLTNIVVGTTYNNYLQVLKGLNDGETVVTSGQDNLEDGYKVHIVE